MQAHSSFDAALRVVAAGLGISVIPLQATRGFTAQRGIKVIPLTDAWAQRRFAVCFRDRAALAPAELRMVEHLAAKAQRGDGAVTGPGWGSPT